MNRTATLGLVLLASLAACEDNETLAPSGGATAAGGGGSTATGGGGSTSTGGTTATGGGGSTSTGGGGAGGTTATGGSMATGGSGGQGGQGGSGAEGGQGGQGGTGGATGLTAKVETLDVSLSWTPPGSSSGYTGVRLVRRLDTPPDAADDPAATLVYEGTAASALDDLENLLPSTAAEPRTYHYAVFGCDGAVCDPDGSFAQVSPTLVQALRGGGYNLFWRHAAATICEDNLALGPASDPQIPDWWKSCDESCPPTGMATTRQLDSFGKMQAPSIGLALEMLGVPFGKVLSSEYCRCKGTAELYDLGPAIETAPALTYWVYDEANRCNLTYDLLETKPAPDTNTALVSHAGFTCPTLDVLAWGEAAIFKPDGAGGTVLVQRVLWDGWDEL